MDVVEVKMSSGQWTQIKYETVPSRANLVYNTAFLRNDEERRRAFLGAVKKGEKTIRGSALPARYRAFNMIQRGSRAGGI